ncbi:DUF5675 family protein [Methyloversatilis sp.]|uniref:DUF5675 family protein n=1 Tax=Methyloversatilis sp. TaxID=2569862 RepID=UPI0027342DD1|nr:DUF5675 family protein [Methyloversatilis sp.]MDP3579147.1 DUF5675 family protein [Methyloversatilis sp.]
MIKLQLVRTAYLSTCVLGTLYAGDAAFATIERPWLPDPDGIGGVRRESCIPDGDYQVSKHSSQKFPDVWILSNPDLGVWGMPGEIPKDQKTGRSAVLIHAGNRVRDVIGCIAVGLKHGSMEGEHAVISSQIALKDMRSILGTGNHVLSIRTTPGASRERLPFEKVLRP